MHRTLRLILSILFILSPAFAYADRIALTITVTNTPSSGNTLVVNGNTRTWRSSVTTPATEILIGASIGATTTNLWQQIAGNGYTGPLNLQWVATNQFRLVGQNAQALTASASGTWATLTLSTQTVTTATSVRVPLSSEPTSSVRTSVANHLIADVLNTYGTTLASATAPPLANYVAKSTTQTITGDKTFTGTGTRIEAGTITNTELQAVRVKYVTNNLPVKFYDSGAVASYAIGPDTDGIPSLYEISVADNITNVANVVPNSANLMNALSADNRYGRLASANAWTAANTFSGTGITNSVIGSSTLVSPTSSGTFTLGSALNFPRANITSLANGNNANIDFGTSTVYAKIKPGPTASFTLNGIAGGANGRLLIVENATSQSMTIAHDSGVDPTAGNRIYNMSGSDTTSLGNSTAIFVYDSEWSRWKLVSFDANTSGNVSGLTAHYVPYATSSTTLGNSPWYRIGTNQMGFNYTNSFLFAPGSPTSGNIYIGYNGPASTAGQGNVTLGIYAGAGLATSYLNTAIGFQSMLGGTITGTGNTGAGSYSLINLTTGSENTAVGDQALDGITTGSYNTGLGYITLHNNSYGSYNVAVGANSGTTSTNSFNTLVGSLSDVSVNTDTNSIAIGYGVKARGSSTAQIGTNGLSVLYLNGTVGWYRGTGTPEGSVTANVGSFYSRENGGASTSFYVKESGTGNTGWVAK